MKRCRRKCGNVRARSLAGTIIGHGAGGTLTHYWLAGFVAVGATLLAIVLAWRVEPVA